MTVVDVDVVLDLREWANRPRDGAAFADLWTQVERSLGGTDLRRAPVHQVRLPAGLLRVQAVGWRAGAPTVVSSGLACRVVTVLERPAVRRRCAKCRDEGVFRCAACPGAERLCAAHARFLDGSLTATCDQHRPRCADCAKQATFRCAGDTCTGAKAFCDRHRREHERAAGWSYCPSCYAQGFPECSVGRCAHPGSALCEFTDDRLRPCGARLCTGHLRPWQIYGPDRLGLALCGRHEQALRTEKPDGLVRRIVAGTHTRTVGDPATAEALPTIRGVEYTLRNFGHYAAADDPGWIHRTLTGTATGFGSAPGAAGLAALVARRDTDGPGSWRTEMGRRKENTDLGREIWAQLCAVLRRNNGEALATGLEYQSYTPPRPRYGQPGRLFLVVPGRYRGAFADWQQWMGDQLSAARGTQITVQRHRGGRA
jgi:hypothetical protein